MVIIIFTIGKLQDGHPRYAHINEDLSSKNKRIISLFLFSTEIQGFFHAMLLSSQILYFLPESQMNVVIHLQRWNEVKKTQQEEITNTFSKQHMGTLLGATTRQHFKYLSI